MRTIYIWFIFISTCNGQNFTLTEFPSNNQLFARNVSTNTALIKVSGDINEMSGYNNLTLKVYRDEILINTINQNLTYTSGLANFYFETSIVAELNNYSFKLYNNSSLIKEAINVVAGDVMLFYGQSNIVGNGDIPSILPYEFIRSYGKFPHQPDYPYWYSSSNVGGIAYKLASEIISNINIPVCILNGGNPGKPIADFLRDDTNPTNQNTNYGKLLLRFQEAGFTNDNIRSFVWYQGEANWALSTIEYKDLFNDLLNDVVEDFNPTKQYIFQVRKGCGVLTWTNVFEAHRQLGNELINATTISTNGVEQTTDNCHYSYLNGYEVFGERLYNLIKYEVYNLGTNEDIYSPDINNIRFTNENKDEIKFNLSPSSDSFILESGIAQDFYFTQSSSTTVTNVSILGNEVTLTLSNSLIESFPRLSYLGNNPNSFPFIKNQNNIGMLSFKDVLINLPNTSVIIDDGWSYYYYESDTVNPVFGIEHLPGVISANTINFTSDVNITSDNLISSSLGKEATFNLGKWWNITTEPTPNGWVNIRFFYSSTLESNLVNAATNFKNTQESSYVSPIMFVKTDQVYDPSTQIISDGLIIPIQKSGVSSSLGNYNGNDFVQINEIQLEEITGGSAIVKVTNILNQLKPGTIQFNKVSKKFQGWNGTQWVDFN
jgi:hypothetical protein